MVHQRKYDSWWTRADPELSVYTLIKKMLNHFEKFLVTGLHRHYQK